MRRALLAALLVALAAAPVAAAHGGAASKLFLSTVTAIRPALPGVTATILLRDDQVLLDNGSGQTLTILGYEGEPYLRFDAKGVSVNVHSPAGYLNSDRYAKVALPASADAKLPPSWRLLTLGRSWSWHDHRIHWMSTILPPVAQANPKVQHVVFDWAIPVQVAGRPAAKILGRLTYIPPKGGTDLGLIVGIALPVGIVLLAGAATAFQLLRRRRALGA